MSESRAAQLAALGAATLGECGAKAMAPRIRAVWSGSRVCGPAATARCAPGDNLAVHVALAEAASGVVVVADAHGAPERGYWGEVLTTEAVSRGVAGLVIDGMVRDTAALAALGFPVFAVGVALRGASKVGGGEVGGEVEVGGVTVGPGDWVVGDEDGVVVVPVGQVAQALDAGRARAGREAEMFEELRAGRTTVDLLGLDPSAVHRGWPAGTDRL
ncbi:MAG: RraA family protein [Acidimicrobiales bacterium]